jgi:hypothetical protein
MAGDKRSNKSARREPGDAKLNPFPGITGPGAEKNEPAPTGGKTDGLFSDPGDGTIGEVGERYRERVVGGPDVEGRSPEPRQPAGGASSQAPRTSGDNAGQLPHGPGGVVAGSPQGGMGADDVGGMGTGTGRGRGSGTPGGVAGGGDSAGTGGMGGGFDSQTGTGGASGGLGNDIGGGLTGGTGGQGLPRRSDQTSTGGGVAVSGGRGSDVGTVGGGMAPDLSADTTGGFSGGTTGGSRESDLGGGLSGGMRSGTGKDVSGAIGDSDDEAAEGDQQRNPRRRKRGA